MDGEAALTALVHLPGQQPRRLAADELGQIGHLRSREGGIVWVDVADPGDAEIDLLRREFDLHPLAEEDIALRRQRPRIDTYPSQYVLIVYESLRPGPAGPDEADTGTATDEPLGARPHLGELHLLAGPGYLVSVHWGASPVIADLQRRFTHNGGGGASGENGGLGRLLYDLLDAVVDGYFPLLDLVAERIDDLEDRIVAGGQGNETLREVLRVKRFLLELRRILAPQREVANALLRRDVELVEEEVVPYYQDLYDHLVRVLDQLDLYRDLVAAALDANLAVTSNQLNAVMKRLTAFTVILMVPTLIAGIYGMNFRYMPELGAHAGYPVALAAMAATMLGLAWFFWRKDWF